MRSIYHLAKADFLQRVRSYAFLITLAVCMYVTYTFVPSPDANYITVSLGNYRGLYNSAWIGVMVAMMCSAFLSLAGFYLVNDSVQRDYDTGVGQIVATTQVSNWQYLMGKMLSNLGVLMSVVAAVALMATFIVMTKAEIPGFDPWNLYVPLLWITLPTLTFIAALAAFFETFRWRNRGLMNVLYFFLFIFFMSLAQPKTQAAGQLVAFSDLFGVHSAFENIKSDLRQQVSDYDGGQSIGYLFGDKKTERKAFEWKGLHWSFGMLLPRLVWIGLAIGLLGIGAYTFRRFDPAYDPIQKEKKRKSKTTHMDVAVPDNFIPYASLPKPVIRFAFATLVKAEAKLMLKGISKWWWLVNAGLFVATVFTPLSVAHRVLLPILWLWQVLVWSGMGSRELLHQTEQVIFSSAHVLTRQLFAGWVAAVTWALLLASAVMVRSLLAGEGYVVYAIFVGAVFLPSFALASGIWTGGGKLFQVIYPLLWYAVIQQVPYIDYLGAVPVTHNWNLASLFAGITVGMLVLSVLGRRRQMYV